MSGWESSLILLGSVFGGLAIIAVSVRSPWIRTVIGRRPS